MRDDNWGHDRSGDAFWTREGAGQQYSAPKMAYTGYDYYGQNEPQVATPTQPQPDPQTMTWTQPGTGYAPTPTGQELAPVYPGPQMYQRLPEHPKATTALVFGILSIVAFAPLGIVALVLASKGRAEFDANPGRWAGRDQLTAAYILGIITTSITALVALLLVFAFFLAVGGF